MRPAKADNVTPYSEKSVENPFSFETESLSLVSLRRLGAGTRWTGQSDPDRNPSRRRVSPPPSD